MRKIICCFLTLFILLSFSACGNTPAEQNSNKNTDNQSSGIVDLTILSSTMVYSEVYNMISTPEKYIGKTVKMNGMLDVYEDSTTGKNYYACIIADATACCAQGLEFILREDKYPKSGTAITVIGKFDTYEEGGYKYCRLIDAKLPKSASK